MNDVYIGTLIPVSQFLDANSHAIKIGDKQVTELKKDRIYIVPKYQREIRWEQKNVYELIRDIDDGKNFLGNIILKEVGTNYEVIDGQQRITSLLMIIDYIHSVYADRDALLPIDPCRIKIETFESYEALRDNKYDEGQLNEEQVKEDLFCQRGRYCSLWRAIESNETLAEPQKQQSFLERLQDCDFNVMIINSEQKRLPINYFVSVNQKGVRLDTEDIFKGYLFQYNPEVVYSPWTSIKQKCISINSKYKTAKSTKEIYPILLLIEHYYYCQLYNYPEVQELSFNKEFLLNEDFTFGKTVYEKGTHLLTVLPNIRNISTISSDLKNIDEIASFLEGFLCVKFPESEISKYLNDTLQKSDKKLSDDGIKCISKLLLHILLSNDYMPKVLAIKYIIDVLLNKDVRDCKDKSRFNEIKESYYSIFTLFSLSILFSVFSKKKKRDQIYQVVREHNWVNNASTLIKWYLEEDNHKVDSLTNITYKIYSEFDDDENTRRDQHLSRAMAAVFNFLVAKEDQQGKIYTLSKNKHQDLFNFYNRMDLFSLEHFIINDSKGYVIQYDLENKKTYSYPRRLQKYAGYIYNYIYINNKINSEVLSNHILPAKMEILFEEGHAFDLLSDEKKSLLEANRIQCAFSKEILKILYEGVSQKKPKMFPSYWEAYWDSIKTTDNNSLERYFESKFEYEFLEFSKTVNIVYLKHWGR